MERWSSFIAINKLFVIRMLSMKDSDSESLLWKMNAVEVVALAADLADQNPTVLQPQLLEPLGCDGQRERQRGKGWERAQESSQVACHVRLR